MCFLPQSVSAWTLFDDAITCATNVLVEWNSIERMNSLIPLRKKFFRRFWTWEVTFKIAAAAFSPESLAKFMYFLSTLYWIISVSFVKNENSSFSSCYIKLFGSVSNRFFFFLLFPALSFPTNSIQVEAWCRSFSL